MNILLILDFCGKDHNIRWQKMIELYHFVTSEKVIKSEQVQLERSQEKEKKILTKE